MKIFESNLKKNLKHKIKVSKFLWEVPEVPMLEVFYNLRYFIRFLILIIAIDMKLSHCKDCIIKPLTKEM